MTSHKLYITTHNSINYKVLNYYNDDKSDYKYVNKIINKYQNLIIIEKNHHTHICENIIPYHPYYNPGIELYKKTYYNNGEIIDEYEETYCDYLTKKLKKERAEKLNRIKENL